MICRHKLLQQINNHLNLKVICHGHRKIHDIRNIGILAHIDAGKTTTTERMLFYSGKTRCLGEVHHGNTISDCLVQERERGITICSSAVTFTWDNCKINLLDTPGHIDFTMEVEQSLNAVDGAIVVLDGSAGVEAQTITVWSQSERYQLPKIIFINKMDRSDSDLLACLKDIEHKLDVLPLHLQWPIKTNNLLEGIIDIIELKQIIWNPKNLGRDFMTIPLTASIKDQMIEERNKIIDKLSEFNDEIADALISNESFDQIPNQLIYNAIKKCTVEKKLVPVFLGSAYKNVGVQPLIDGVIKFLPKPIERNRSYNCFGNDLAAKVFKIIHDKHKGPLTLVRVFRGNLNKGMRIITSKGGTEVLQKIYEPLADEYREISSILTGDIAVCAGLKGTVTGDLILSSASSLKNAQNKLQELLDSEKLNNKLSDSNLIESSFSIEPEIPDAVYFCSIEPPSLKYQNALENALTQLQREDPSLRVTFDDTTGQTVLGGMGELHIEVIKSRILTEYKIDADLGPLQIAYKEAITSEMEETFTIEKEIAGSKQNITIKMSMTKNEKEIFILDTSPDNVANLKSLKPRILQIIKKSAVGALNRGPRLGGSVINTQIKLHRVEIGRGTVDSFIMAAAAQCVQKILTKAGTYVLEPIMSIQIIVPSDTVSPILGDLTKRRATINDVCPKGNRNKLIEATAPLAELTGYSNTLRTISSGTASMTMQPSGYVHMNSREELIAIRRAQGLE